MQLNVETIQSFLISKKFNEFFDYLAENEIADFYLQTYQPFKYKTVKGEFKVMEHEELPTLELIERLQSELQFHEESNRAILPDTLHRISRIVSTDNQTVSGLTFRVSRFITTGLHLLSESPLVNSNILIVGKPGVGKTTYLRALASCLSEVLHTVVVDKCNEIAGEGHSTLPELGQITRLSVPYNTDQYYTIVEAIENHSPDVVIVDEISNRHQAQAVKEACQRGVNVIATLHGNSLDSAIRNPIALSLFGGVNNSTIGDKKAREAETYRKTISEQIYPSVFNLVVILKSHNEIEIVSNVEKAVQDILNGKEYKGEWRLLKEEDPTKYVVLGKETE